MAFRLCVLINILCIAYLILCNFFYFKFLFFEIIVEESTEEILHPLHEAAKRGNLAFLKECLENKVFIFLNQLELIILTCFII